MGETMPLRFEDRAAFRDWAERQPRKRWERQDGLVVAVPRERVGHTRIKGAVWGALDAALRGSGLPCEAFGSGPAIEIDDGTDYEPDAVVSLGEPLDGDAVAVPNPVIVVEVTCPETAYRDHCVKLDGYFRLQSVQHYLIFACDAVRVVHHQRWTEERLLTRLHHGGTIELDPPGIGLAVVDCYRGTELPGAP